jgi:dihydroorotate dehydrogenase (fumarate)
MLYLFPNNYCNLKLTSSNSKSVTMVLNFHPPLLNTANPWCSSVEQLRELYESPHTGAVTVRTSLLNGFKENPAIHMFTFFDSKLETSRQINQKPEDTVEGETTSLNTLGYSPIPLYEYLEIVKGLVLEGENTPESEGGKPKQLKPFILSITGSPAEISEALVSISDCARDYNLTLLAEINLSCPNIDGAPPPAYSGPALSEYLSAIQKLQGERDIVPVGIKTPPYTYGGQFEMVIHALEAYLQHGKPVITFITAVNTLGGCLVLSEPSSQPGLQPQDQFKPALGSANGMGIGGLAGAALHPLALGNVKTLRTMLDARPHLKDIAIIGAGGVEDAAGFNRMRVVGASVVGVGTALGRNGITVFDDIARELWAEEGVRRNSVLNVLPTHGNVS